MNSLASWLKHNLNECMIRWVVDIIVDCIVDIIVYIMTNSTEELHFTAVDCG